MKKTLRHVVNFFFYPIYLILYFFNIKIGFIRSSRIGHLTADTELFIILKKKKILNSRDLIFYDKQEHICNNFLFNLVRKKIKIRYSNKFLSKFINYFIKNFDLESKVQKNNGKFFYLFKTENQIFEFTKKQKEVGDGLLKDLGINSGDEFVCIHNRDTAYLDQKQFSKNYKYHDFRNFEIHDFDKSFEFCESQGLKIIRMGQKQNEKIKKKSNYLIDYAFSPFRSDFLDVYISSKCIFYLGSASGYWGLPNLFRKKIFIINQIEDMFAHIIKNDGRKYIFKKIYDFNKNRILNFSEMLELNIYEIFNNNNNLSRYRLINNTPDDILDLMKEAISEFNGSSLLRSDLDEKILKIFSKYVNFDPKNIDTRLGRSFAEQNTKILN